MLDEMHLCKGWSLCVFTIIIIILFIALILTNQSSETAYHQYQDMCQCQNQGRSVIISICKHVFKRLFVYNWLWIYGDRGIEQPQLMWVHALQGARRYGHSQSIILQSILVNRPVLEHNALHMPGTMGALRVKYYNKSWWTGLCLSTSCHMCLVLWGVAGLVLCFFKYCRRSSKSRILFGYIIWHFGSEVICCTYWEKYS